MTKKEMQERLEKLEATFEDLDERVEDLEDPDEEQG